MLSRDVLHRPRPDILLEPGEAPETGSGTLSARRGVVWISGLERGAGLFMDLIDGVEDGSDVDAAAVPIPLTNESWLTLMRPIGFSVQSSESLAQDGNLLPALAGFHSTALSLERLNRSLAVVDRANLEQARAANRRTDEERARHRLFNLYGLSREPGAGAGDRALFEALEIVGRHEGIDFKWPRRTDIPDSTTLLGDVLDTSGVRGRQVRLALEDKWWTGDSGAMLAFRAEDGRPVALLPSALGRYRAIDPADGSTERVTAESAGGFGPEAWLFYRPLPSAGVTPRDLMRLARSGLGPDLVRYLAAGLLGGLVMLLPAVAVGLIADEVIPTGEAGLLYTIAAALTALAAMGALLHVLKGMALMRLEGRAASRMEAAVWDRLLRLPPRFLRRYPAGDLALRGMTFQNLRDALQSVVADAVLSILFLSPVVVLVFFFDAALVGAIVAFVLLSLTATVALGMRQIAPHGRVIRAVHRLGGRLFQLINGISKLRVDGAEGSAFAVWAEEYREQKQAELELGRFEEHLRAFSAALPFLAAAVLFLAAGMQDRGTFTVGGFLVVFMAFLVFQTAVARLGESFGAVAAIVPAFDQMRPFLEEPPETGVQGESVETLSGEILFDHVTFRYAPDGPLILDDVSIRVRPGEFVAIAGESGAGKSTLFRLALGLDQPSSGAVYYDGRDLRHLNLRQLRRKIGVVPQEVRLHPEDIWDNIAADSEEATVEDAWEAARLAAVDQEIAAMPMGMLTCVGASAAVTSGGESQRIVIAQALMRNPRVMLLDEATNWLDNDSQARVMENLAQLSSTRVVIAHRLSTLRQADRIFVMQAGKVVQEGTFAELAETEGVFRDLVRRQVA